MIKDATKTPENQIKARVFELYTSNPHEKMTRYFMVLGDTYKDMVEGNMKHVKISAKPELFGSTLYLEIIMEP